MANGFLAAVWVLPEARREWLLAAAALGAACCLALAMADLPLPVRLAAGMVAALRLGFELRGRLSSRAMGYVSGVAWLPGGRWRLETGAGVVMARLAHAWGTSRGPVIVMEWACEDGRRRQAWLWRHRCPALQWRRLRVHLRLT